mmetsp:Transcript_50408/g.51280  ORF Transcript_50408/g.51280 Transcript_50408/m.51280 type:complete len:89 (+) Transcript_50408:1025-1291(+)
MHAPCFYDTISSNEWRDVSGGGVSPDFCMVHSDNIHPHHHRHSAGSSFSFSMTAPATYYYCYGLRRHNRTSIKTRRGTQDYNTVWTIL